MRKTILTIVVFIAIIASTKEVYADQSFYSNPEQINIVEVNPFDGWIKLYNTGNTPVDLAGWVFYDESDDHEYFITLTNLLGGKLILNGYEETLINVKEDSDFRLKEEGMELRLYNGPVEIEGELIDQTNYPKLENGESYEVISNIQLPITNEISNENSNEISNANNESEKIPAQGRDDLRRRQESNEAIQQWNNEKEIDPSTTSSTGSDSAQDDLGVLDENRNRASLQPSATSQEPNLAMKQFNNENKTFTASSPLEKLPYALAYRLWNNWFLRRIILPFFILWAGLFAIAHFVRKKYLS